MAKTRVYRMENDEGRGPYMARWKEAARDVHPPGSYNAERHPPPQDDRLDKVNRYGARFAFGSPEQARAWFNNEEQDHLHKKGFALNAYEVDSKKVKRGGKQVAVVDPKPGDMQKMPTPKITVE